MKSLVFSVDELYKCSTQSERRNHHLTKENFEEQSQSLMSSLERGNYTFSFSHNEKNFFNSKTDKFDYLFQDLVLRKIYKNIKTVYKLTQSNRDKIISQIKILLEEKSPYWILKLDIKSFYESINCKDVIQKLKKDYRLNRQTLDLMEKILTLSDFDGFRGVPRGLCVSSIISELYMKKFDLEVKRINGVYYYARFVDDIILFCNSSFARDCVENEIKKMFKNRNLQINFDKFRKWDKDSCECLTYLGYAFKHASDNALVISIAQNKVKKIKTRIIKSFINYTRNHDFLLLKKRIKFLSGNIVLKRKTSLSPIYVGIFYNYKKISDTSPLKEIDSFYQKIIHSKKGTLGVKLFSLLNAAQINELKKFSFTFGHEKKVRHYFSAEEMKMIVRCWHD